MSPRINESTVISLPEPVFLSSYGRRCMTGSSTRSLSLFMSRGPTRSYPLMFEWESSASDIIIRIGNPILIISPSVSRCPGYGFVPVCWALRGPSICSFSRVYVLIRGWILLFCPSFFCWWNSCSSFHSALLFWQNRSSCLSPHCPPPKSEWWSSFWFLIVASGWVSIVRLLICYTQKNQFSIAKVKKKVRNKGPCHAFFTGFHQPLRVVSLTFSLWTARKWDLS